MDETRHIVEIVDKVQRSSTEKARETEAFQEKFKYLKNEEQAIKNAIDYFQVLIQKSKVERLILNSKIRELKENSSKLTKLQSVDSLELSLKGEEKKAKKGVQKVLPVASQVSQTKFSKVKRNKNMSPNLNNCHSENGTKPAHKPLEEISHHALLSGTNKTIPDKLKEVGIKPAQKPEKKTWQYQSMKGFQLKPVQKPKEKYSPHEYRPAIKKSCLYSICKESQCGKTTNNKLALSDKSMLVFQKSKLNLNLHSDLQEAHCSKTVQDTEILSTCDVSSGIEKTKSNLGAYGGYQDSPCNNVSKSAQTLNNYDISVINKTALNLNPSYAFNSVVEEDSDSE